jgi:squalene-hopene/tetraprenyl-beta-curcumene cyclase
MADAADSAKKAVGPSRASLDATRNKAIAYLRLTQADDGSWTAPVAPGITGLIATALMQNGVPASDPTVAQALKHLESHIKKDGGVYFAKSNHRNYETCIAVLAFNEANAKGRYTKQIKAAEKFLRGLQWDKGEGLEDSDTGFGGAGYGKHQRPDLSNTQFLIEALKAAGVKADDPAMQNALKFVSRTQNLETEHNTTPFAAKINDGGFYYTPAAGGTSQAGLSANGGLRSYGSMTYAGLKSMIYAGLKTDDRRVKAAFTWIQRFYTVEENPGLGKMGLYYYYHTFAKTLSVLDADFVEDADGRQHDWRAELTAKLAKNQQNNGSWVNKADRWNEGDPNLSTAYGLLALSHCNPRSAKPTKTSK